MSHELANAVVSRINHRPMLIAPTASQQAMAALRSLAQASDSAHESTEQFVRSELLAAYGFDDSYDNHDKPFAFAKGIALIPITGLLLNRFGRSWGWVTGYNAIRLQLNAALDDEDVDGILFDVNSYGGEAAGCFELADEIREARAVKPSLAIVDSAAYSAGYALGSAAGRMVVTPSSGVGSIGVVAMHVSYEKALEEWGVDVTFIFSGDHKVDGNPYQALPAAVRKDIQEDVDATRDVFVNLVANNRGLDAKTIHDTEAQTYRAEDALTLGLVDAVVAPSKAVSSFISELSGSGKPMENFAMSKQTEKPGDDATAPDNNAAAEAAAQAAATTARAEGAAEGATSERQRIAAITTCDEAKGKSGLANHLALNTDLSVDAAKGILKASPAENAAVPDGKSGASAFERAMGASEHPDVGADAGAGDGGDGGNDSMAAAKRILQNHSAATGTKYDA